MASGDLTTLSAVKRWLGISSDNDDTLFGDLITQVSAFVENTIQRTVLTATHTETYRGTGGSRFLLRNWPVRSVTSVEWGETRIDNAVDAVGNASGIATDGRSVILVGSRNGESFIERSRRLKMWDKAPVPGLYQIEGSETVTSLDGQLDKHSLRASWIIYHRGGKDQSATPAETSNAILDAVEAAFRPALPGARQTLGGLAYRTFIDGTIHKDNGDLDGQAMLIVPITIILP